MVQAVTATLGFSCVLGKVVVTLVQVSVIVVVQALLLLSHHIFSVSAFVRGVALSAVKGRTSDVVADWYGIGS